MMDLWNPSLVDLFAVLFPFLVGVSLGMIGGGGTILAVPILIYIYRLDTKSAIALSLGVVAIVSLVGSFSHWRQGHVRLDNAAFFTPWTMLGAFIGVKISGLEAVTGTVQLILFCITVILASIFMIFRKSHPKLKEPKEGFLFSGIGQSEAELGARREGSYGSAVEPESGDPAKGEPSKSFYVQNGYVHIELRTVWVSSVLGLGVGMLTGLVGVGGGFLIVPALVFISRLEIHHAIGTSLVIIFFNSLSGFIGYLGRVDIDISVLFQFSFVSLLGVFWGARYSRRIPRERLQRIFGIFLFGIGLWVVWVEFLKN
jgi:uncharacterized membrane protein YfcA